MKANANDDSIGKPIRIALMIILIVWLIPTLVGFAVKLSVEVWKNDGETAPLERKELEQVPSDGDRGYFTGLTTL